MSLFKRFILVSVFAVALAILLKAIEYTANESLSLLTTLILAAASVGIFIWRQMRPDQVRMLPEATNPLPDVEILGSEIRTWIVMISYAAMVATAITHPFTRLWNHFAIVVIFVACLAVLAVYNRLRFGMFLPGGQVRS